MSCESRVGGHRYEGANVQISDGYVRKQRPRICKNITETIGNTPMVYLDRLTKNLPGRAVAKLESFNPLSSVKDRIGLAMIEAAEQSGALRPGMTIVEPTGGNTGIALASVATVKGYEAIFVMPDHMSSERRRIMQTFGAKLILGLGAPVLPRAGGYSDRIPMVWRRRSGCWRKQSVDFYKSCARQCPFVIFRFLSKENSS